MPEVENYSFPTKNNHFMWKTPLRNQLLKQPNHIWGLDSFRGFAAIIVFAFHFYGFFLQNQIAIPNWLEPFLAGGHIGINIFFVLSGFLVFLSFIRSRSIGSYIYKRFIRIAPLALAYLVVVFWYKGNFQPQYWQDLWIHATFTQSLFKTSYHGQFPVMWTLSLELMFYLFVPLFAWIARRNFKIFILGLILLTLTNWGYRFWVSQFFESWSNFERIFYSEQLWGRFDHFALGICLAIVYSKGYLSKNTDSLELTTKYLFLQKLVPYLLTIIGFTSFLYLWYKFGIIGSAFRDQIWLQIFLHSSVALSFTIFLAGFIQIPSPKKNQSSSKILNLLPNFSFKNFFAPTWLQYLGKLSYGIYLWHFFVLEIFLELDFDLAPKILLVTATTIGLSVISWHTIEEPFLKGKSQTAALGKNF
jgi:peptidoglycan/LPS O-acetylase OafA/YrhL